MTDKEMFESLIQLERKTEEYLGRYLKVFRYLDRITAEQDDKELLNDFDSIDALTIYTIYEHGVHNGIERLKYQIEIELKHSTDTLVYIYQKVNDIDLFRTIITFMFDVTIQEWYEDYKEYTSKLSVDGTYGLIDRLYEKYKV